VDSSSYGQLTKTRNPVDYSVLSIECMGLSLSWETSQEIPLTDKTRLVLNWPTRKKCVLKMKILLYSGICRPQYLRTWNISVTTVWVCVVQRCILEDICDKYQRAWWNTSELKEGRKEIRKDKENKERKKGNGKAKGMRKERKRKAAKMSTIQSTASEKSAVDQLRDWARD
jgi:hypothetical protein